MDSTEKMKDLRNALGQAAIETQSKDDHEGNDPCSLPLADVVARLEKANALPPSDAAVVRGVLDGWDVDHPDAASAPLPDELDTELSRIIANLRSIRLNPVSDPEGRGRED